MKKEVTVKVKARPAVPAKTKQVVKVLCDICGKSTADHYGNQRRCYICKRDICPQHTKYDDSDGSDYPDKWCPICAKLWPPIRSEMNKRHWAEEEKLESQIKKQSLEQVIDLVKPNLADSDDVHQSAQPSPPNNEKREL